MTRLTFLKKTFVIFGLMSIHIFAFSQSNNGFGDFSVFGFDFKILDFRFDRADREINPHKWIQEARFGISSARILLEEMIPEIYRNSDIMNDIFKEFDEWTEYELEERFTQWLLFRFFSYGSEFLSIEVLKEREKADRLFLYKTDDLNNILFDDITGDPLIYRPNDEAFNFNNDLHLWREYIEDSTLKELAKYESNLIELFPEILIYIDETKREDFGHKLTSIYRTAVQSIKNELSSLLAREERLFTARRLGDVYSLRKKSEDESASAIGISLIEETRRITEEGLSALKAQIEAAEASTGDLALAGADWLEQYRAQFERGLRAWEEAEERFFIRRIEWEHSAIQHYYEAEAAWNDAFIEFDEARKSWEISVRLLFESGERLFINTSLVLDRAILEAKAEFARDSRIRTESASEKAKAWADMYLTSLSIVMEASKNLDFWQDRYLKETDKNSVNSLIIIEEIDHWTYLYEFYHKKASEAKNFLENEFNIILGDRGLKEVLSKDTSSEDFFLDEYQVELLRAQAVAGYWSKRVDIAQAVLTYAENLTAGRVTESEGIRNWEIAKENYNNALLDYEYNMEILKIIGYQSSIAQEKMNEAALKLRESEITLEELNRKYQSLISVYEIQKENYLLDDIESNYMDLMIIAAILDNNEPNSIRMRYLRTSYELGLYKNFNFDVELLKEIILGGLFFNKSLEQITNISENIKVFNQSDLIPTNVFEFGIPMDNPLFFVLDELLWERDYLFKNTIDNSEKEKTLEYYDKMILALCSSAKTFAIRQKTNRIFILEMIISDKIEDKFDYELHSLFFDLEIAKKGLSKSKLELEIMALSYFLYDEIVTEDAILLSKFCFLDKEDAIKALEALHIILSIINDGINKDMLSITEDIKEASLNNEFILYYNDFGSFFSASNGFSYTNLLMNSYIDNIEFIEGLISAYQIAGLINPLILNSILADNIQELSNMYTKFDIILSGNVLPDNINDFVESIILNSINPLEEIACFLVLFDKVFDILPEWINSIAVVWKELFIELCINNLSGNYKNNLILDNSLKRQTQLLNSSLNLLQNTDKKIEDSYLSIIKKYIENPVIQWIDIDFNQDNLLFLLNDFEILSNEFNNYLYIEQFLLNNIKELQWNLELFYLNDGSLEKEIDTITSEINYIKQLTDSFYYDYYETSLLFSQISQNYDNAYSNSKNSYYAMDNRRFEYEIEDAIRRWADTAYLGIDIPAQDLIYSNDKLIKSQAVLDVLSSLYSNNESTRPFKNPEYLKAYEDYKNSYKDLYVSIKVSEIMNNTLENKKISNQLYYNEYKNQLNIFGSYFLYDINILIEENSEFNALFSIINVIDNRLVFSIDDSEENSKILKDFFFPSLILHDKVISQFELSLFDFVKRLESYNFTYEKYIQWGLAKDYLLSQVSIQLDNDMIVLLNKSNIPPLLASNNRNKNAWDGLSTQEKLDLEYFTILSLVKPDLDFFNRISELLNIEDDLRNAQEHLKNVTRKSIISVFFLGFPYLAEVQEAQYRVNQIIPRYNYLKDGVIQSNNDFKHNIDYLIKNFENYIDSSNIIDTLQGKSENITWDEINNALLFIGIDETEINLLQSFWQELLFYYDFSGLNIPEILNFILYLKKNNLLEKQTEFDFIWNKFNEERIIAENEYKYFYEIFLLDDISLDMLEISMHNAFGSNTASLKKHLLNSKNLIMENLELFKGNIEGFLPIQELLMSNFINIMDVTNINNFKNELTTRENEWKIQYNDIEEKYQDWIKSSFTIIEKGNEDWKNNNIKLIEAYSHWNKMFEEEYTRISEAWIAAYLEGLKDKEVWAEKAAKAAFEASSEAVLILMGADAEAMSRAMDMRDPVSFQDLNGVLEARQTLVNLLNTDGIGNLSQIFNSLNSITGTLNTRIRNGLNMNNISHYGIIKSEASNLARNSKEELRIRENVRIAMNLNDIANEALKVLEVNINNANNNIISFLDETFIMEGSWRRAGIDYFKQVLVHSTFFDAIITDSVTIPGYQVFTLGHLGFKTNLNEQRIKNLDSIAIQRLMDNLLFEISGLHEKVFGTPGEFDIHVGNAPEILKSNINIDNGKPGVFIHYGDGELGRLLTEYYYWYFKEQKGESLLAMAPWDKPLIDFRGFIFDAPSLRGSAILAAQIVATIITYGQALPAMIAINLALLTANDLIFTALDVGGGYKSPSQAFGEFGKSMAMNVVSSVASGVTGQVSKGIAGAVQNNMISPFKATVQNTLVKGASNLTTGTINSFIGAVTYDNEGGWTWSSDLYSSGMKNTFRSSLASVTSSLTSGILNIGNEGFQNGESHSKHQLFNNGSTLNNMTGGLIGQGLNLALGGDFSLNLLNLNMFDERYNLGLLELNMGRNGINFGLGTGGVDVSFGAMQSAVKGFETWKVNLELFMSDTEASSKYKVQLRSLYSGNDILRQEYEDVLAGRTEYREDRDVNYTISRLEGGIKYVYLGNDALNDGSRFGLSVIFAHEAYRDGIDDNASRYLEHQNAVIGHSQAAWDIVQTYGAGSLGSKMIFESIIYADYLLTGNMNNLQLIIDNYDASGDFHKIIKNDFGKWIAIDDNSLDFDIFEVINDQNFLDNPDSIKEEIMKALEDSHNIDGKEYGTISAERMSPALAISLANSIIISQHISTDQLIPYSYHFTQDKNTRNDFSSLTMNLMAYNAIQDSNLIHIVLPHVLDGFGVVEYLVPVQLDNGGVNYTPMDRIGFFDYFDSLLVSKAMEQVGGNYVWGGKDPVLNGGLDCSGFVRWVQMQVYGQGIASRDAHNQAIHPLLTITGNEGIGSLNFYYDVVNKRYTHVNIDLGNGRVINPTGNQSNTINNPGIIKEINIPDIKNTFIVNRRTNWHYLFFQ